MHLALAVVYKAMIPPGIGRDVVCPQTPKVYLSIFGYNVVLPPGAICSLVVSFIIKRELYGRSSWTAMDINKKTIQSR